MLQPGHTDAAPSASGALRVAYQSFGQERGMERYQARLESLVTGALGPQTSVTMLRLESTLLEGKGFSSAQALDVPALLGSVTAAAEAGVDAIAIGNAFDPGLWEARELLEVPVLGYFETVAFYALRMGWRLGVLCSGTSGMARVEELAARYGIGQRLGQPAAVGATVPQVMAAFGDPALAAGILDACRTGVDELARRGAEVVIIASGALDVFYETHRAEAMPGPPIVPGAVILARELEAAAGLHRLGVPAASRVGRFRMPPEAVRAAAAGRDDPVPDDGA